MPDTALPNTLIPEPTVHPTLDEKALQGFVAQLRKYIMVDLADDMRATYDESVEPAFEKKHGRKPEKAIEVRREMAKEPIYRAYSAMRYVAQELVWDSVKPAVERELPELRKLAAQAAALSDDAKGSLRLNPELDIPRNVTEIDIHLMPGCFHSEYAQDDIYQGALYTFGGRVFSGGLTNAKSGDRGVGAVAESLAQFMKIRMPDFKPKRILDIGCSTGHNTMPWKEVYPEAEVYGVDVGAPMLRYAHMRAMSLGVPIHYSQQDAENLDFPDGHFDFVTSSFFFHEASVKQTKAIMAEIYRLLAPGGMMLHMELPPNDHFDPYYNFYLDWDAYGNNEPYYAQYRQLATVPLVGEAGFGEENHIDYRVPNVLMTSPEDFAAIARGEKEETRIGNFRSFWFYGGKKPA